MNSPFQAIHSRPLPTRQAEAGGWDPEFEAKTLPGQKEGGSAHGARKTAEAASPEGLLTLFLEHSAQVFYSHSVDGQLTYIRPQAEAFFECPHAETPQRWTEFLTDNPINAVGIELTRRAIETGEPQSSYQLELKSAKGRTLWVEVHESPVVAQGRTTSIVGALTNITARKQAEASLLEEKSRYSRQRDALIAITGGARDGETLINRIRHLTETDARTLDVARVSVWRYNDDRTAIHCEDLYELETDRHNAGVILSAAEYPAYFRAIEGLDVISAGDANRDPRTCEFSGNYLKPLGITSMLDARIHLSGTGEGVLCHEHIGRPREWAPDEETFAVAIASRVSLLLESTERHRAEEELRWKTALLEAQVDSSLDGILVVDNQNNQVLKNQRFNEVWKIPHEIAAIDDERKCLEYGASQVKHSAEFLQRVFHLNSHPDEVGFDEIELINGTFLDRYSSPVKDKGGRHYGRIWAFRDVTKQRRAEADLRNAHEQLERMLASSPAVLYRLKVEGENFVPVSVSSNIKRLLGFSPTEAVNQEWWLAQLHPEDRALALASIRELMEHGTSRSEYRVRHKAGNYLWMEDNRRLLRNATSQLAEVIGVWMDITERKHSEAALEQAHSELVDLSRRAGMAEIATSVLHNVGNVLNSVNISAELLLVQVRKTPVADLLRLGGLLRENGGNLGAFFTTDPRGPQVPEFLSKLAEHFTRVQETQLRETLSLQKNIQHIKEIVAAQQGYARISGATESLRITELVEDAIRINGDSLQRHAVKVVRKFAPGLPAVNTEKHKVLQILVNLLNNAKYACAATTSEEKQITVQVTHRRGRLRVEVIDNGMGIPADNLDRVFTHGFTTKKDGHGFGLHSAANTVKELGGSLKLQSVGSGQGTTVTLELPCSQRKETS